MKRTLAWLLSAVLFVLPLAGCQSAGGNETAGPEDTVETQIPEGYYSQPRWNNKPKRRYVKTENYLPADGGKF